MSSVRALNPKAEVLGSQAALFMNINAAKGLHDVMKTNLGARPRGARLGSLAPCARVRSPVVPFAYRRACASLASRWGLRAFSRAPSGARARPRGAAPSSSLVCLRDAHARSPARSAGPKGTIKMLVGGAGGTHAPTGSDAIRARAAERDSDGDKRELGRRTKRAGVAERGRGREGEREGGNEGAREEEREVSGAVL